MLARRTLTRLCAAKPSAPPVEAAAAKAAAEPSPKKATRVTKEVTAFRVMPLHEWQRRGSADKLPSHPLLFHGATLGPRPLVVLGGNVTSDPTQSAVRFSPMLSQLQWSHGALYVSFDFETSSSDALGKAADSVVRVLDSLGIGWTHVVGHSAGALLAAKMAFRFPTRVGTIISLDSPLVQDKWIENQKVREELRKASEDVNVPQPLMDFTKHSLEENVEPPLTYTDPADQALFDEYLFSTKNLFGSSRGQVRDDSRYLSILQLQCLKHPLQFVTPAQGSKLDVDTHKSFFGIRRLQPIKAAASHDALFSTEGTASEEVAQQLEQWIQRFEPDVMYSRRFEQAAKDMRSRMDSASAAPAAAAAEKSTQQFPPGKKKEQKKKK